MFYRKNKKLATFVFTCVFSSVIVFVGATSYRLGDRGTDVKAIQTQLKASGYNVKENGIFTKDTQNAVLSFQQKNKLGKDGIVGPATYKALFGKNIPGDSGSKRKSLNLLFDGSETAFTPAIASSPATVQKLLSFARKYTGVPYRFGGTTPSGFDCSGYVNFVFRNATGVSLPRAADEQYSVGVSVAKKNLQPGDLVFFETYTSGVSHSGIYLGNNKFISATSSRGVVEADMSGGYWSDHYIGAKRVL